MLPNKNHQRTGNSAHSTKQFDQVLDKLSLVKQLSIADQRTAAINMGKLAAIVNPNKPYEGAMQIIAASKLSGVKNKRKRFFRLPGEDAPFPCEPGTYNANPGNFVSLAKAAGRLMSNSSDRALQEKEEERALHALLLGTSYVPSFMPESLAERSVKGLLEEYAVRLAEAIEARTRITQLWDALEVTPINVVSFDEGDQITDYGAGSVFPPELLASQFKSYIKGARFKPDSNPGYGDSWSQPSLQLGYMMATYGLFALKVPDDKAYLFPPVTEDSWAEFEACTSERNTWLESIGFDVIEHCFTDGEVGREQRHLSQVSVAFLHKVSLDVRRGVANKVEVKITTRPTCRHWLEDKDFLVTSMQLAGPISLLFKRKFDEYASNPSSASPFSVVTIGPPIPEEDPEDYKASQDDFDAFWASYGGNCLMAEDVMPPGSETKSKILFMAGGFEEGYWADEDDFNEYNTIKCHVGWIDDPTGAKILLGADNLAFIPTLEDAEPEAGAARAGSVAASILNNAISAPPENRISQLLIDRVALTADAGLNFHNALVEKSRSAISQI
jgi:hypothetical protein